MKMGTHSAFVAQQPTKSSLDFTAISVAYVLGHGFSDVTDYVKSCQFFS
jgi:hypothetical protein